MRAVQTLDAPTAEPAALASLPRERLRDMHAAGLDVLECQRVLEKAGLNVVGELLKGQGTFYQLNHYPKGDVFDRETCAQYYYHAHRGMAGEHGHFHTFVRRGAIPDAMQPVPYRGKAKWPSGDNTVAHLVAVSMDKFGHPIGLFATNRWVTDEAWFRAEDVVALLDSFRIDHAYPSWPTNRWLTGVLRMFRPEVEALLRQRDEVVERWRCEHPERDVFEDRELEVTGELRVSLNKRVAALQALA